MVLMEPLKDLLNVVAMGGQVPGVDEYIIDIDNYEGMEELPEYLVHEFLEDGLGVGKAIRHNEIFIVAGRGNEGHLPFIAFPDSNEVVHALQGGSWMGGCLLEDILQCHIIRWDEGSHTGLVPTK